MSHSLAKGGKAWLKPDKIHKLYLANRFGEMALTLARILFGDLTRGTKTRELEEAFMTRFGVRKAIIFPHARTAVYFVLKSLGLEQGDEVLMTPLTIADMVNSIHTAGLKPVFVDIEMDTLNFDPADLERCITPRSKVLFITYIFGVVPDMKKIMSIAEKHNLLLVEDCSQCLDGQFAGKPIGTFGGAGIFSLTNFKVCSSLFGGMTIISNGDMARKLEQVKDSELLPPKGNLLFKHSMKNLVYTILFSKWAFSYFTYFIVLFLEKLDPRITYRLYSGNIKVLLGGIENKLLPQFPKEYLFNYTDVQARLGLYSFQRAEAATQRRVENGELLRELLKDVPQVRTPARLPESRNVYWRFPLLCEDTAELKKYLLDHGIDSGSTFLVLCSNEPGFEPYHRDTPNAQRLKKKALLLEVSDDVSEANIRYTASVIKSFFARTGDRR
jgi:dTDP-4-amino-4,6-dideoxygalactose transaminase